MFDASTSVYDVSMSVCVCVCERVCDPPVPEARAVAEVAPDQGLQGRQSRATQLLSAGAPAAPRHGPRLPRQPPANSPSSSSSLVLLLLLLNGRPYTTGSLREREGKNNILNTNGK